MSKIVSGIRAARNVHVVAQGPAKGPARIFVSHLRGLLEIPAQLLAAELMDTPMLLSSLAGEDLVIGVSLSPLHDDTAQMLRLAQSQGAKTIGLAASHTSPTASTADLIRVYPSESTMGVPSVACLTGILGAFFQLLARQEPQKLPSFRGKSATELELGIGGLGREEDPGNDISRQF